MKKKTLTLAVAIAIFSTTSYAEDVMSPEVDADQNKISSANYEPSKSVETLADWKSQVQEDFNMTMETTENGRTYYFGEAVVSVGQLDPSYADELQIAYDKAFTQIQVNYVKSVYGKISSERFIEKFQDSSTNNESFDPIKLQADFNEGRTATIFDKALQVVEAKLDSMLIEQGVPADEVKTLNVEQKKTLFKDNFREESLTQAFGNMSGLVAVQTKVLSTERKGKTSVSVGVVGIISDKTLQFAHDIAKQRASVVKGKPSSWKEALPKKGKEFLDEFGLRYMYDDKGRPMLISYGRSSINGKSEDDPSILQSKVNMAKDQARVSAEAAISFFIQSDIMMNEKLTKESRNEKVLKKISEIKNNRVTNETLKPEVIKETINKFQSEARVKTNSKLRGTSQVKTWEFEAEDSGVIHVGSVMSWTYDQLDNANAQANKKTDGGISATDNVAKEKAVPKESRTSRKVNSADDF